MSLRPHLLASATLSALLAAAPVLAQTPSLAQTPPAAPPATTLELPRDGGDIVQAGDMIDFAADLLEYDENAEIVTASGKVELKRDAYSLNADRIEYNRKTGIVIATGNVVTIDPEGNQAFGDRVELTESLRDGAIANILLVLNDGGRLAASSAERAGRIITLRRAVYSPCAVVDTDGCPHEPVWQVRAERISYDRDRHRLSYRKAQLEMFGVPVLYLPRFSHPDGEAKQVSGLLLPDIKFQRQLGLGLSLPYHFALAPDRDVTVTPWVYTAANPALQVQARRLFRDGPVQLDGFFTYTRLTEFAADGVTEVDRGNRFRGYVGVKGRFQHDAKWRSTFSVRLTTDDTFNRRYDLDFDDTLRSTYALERLSSTSFLSISAWAFQGLRITDRAGEIPFVLPIIDYDLRPAEQILGGRLHIGANSMNLFRTDGQSVQRALAFARWDRSFFTPLGQRVTATTLVRGDVYNVSKPELASQPEYAGRRGVTARAIPLAALDIEWPFAGPALGGTQTITPRVQIIASPNGNNDDIPNEDSRAIELENISLFDLNRFPGQDRFEGGSRLTYGAVYTLDRPNWALTSEVGQSIRLAGDGQDFPSGTGLSDRVSDFVGRTNVKFGSLIELTHRFRVDRKSLAVRRNEVDIAVGNRNTYATIGYVKLNRKIELEDLEDREELRVGARVAFARFWSVFGSGIVDLTRREDNPAATGNGFNFIRHRIGAEYEDECFRFGLSWRRDYISDRDFRAGSTFQLSLAFKTLGR